MVCLALRKLLVRVIQRCIIHQLRNTFKYVSYKDSKELMNDFKLVYEAEALSALDIVEEKWPVMLLNR